MRAEQSSAAAIPPGLAAVFPFWGVSRLPRFHLHLITDETRGSGLLTALEAGVAAGVDWVQVRAKSAPAADLYALTRAALQVCRRHGAGLLVNDRLDVAVAAGAHGVHLARKSLSVAAARSAAPAKFLIGASVHTVAEAVTAAQEGADYITFGSVFPTRSHPGAPAQGPEILAAVVTAVDIPVLAIGGITAGNVRSLLDTGVAGVALISAVLAAADPGAAARELRVALDTASSQPKAVFPTQPREV